MGWFDATVRSEAEIEAEIADEIEFHLEQRTRELVEQGMTESEARAEAERRFGSLERVRQSCRWVQLGERIMLQRVQLVLNLVLVTAVVVLGWSFWQSNAHVQDQLYKLSALLEPRAAALAPPEPAAPEPNLERFKTLRDLPAASALASDLAQGELRDGPYWMKEGWALVQDPKLRIALLAPFVEAGGHAAAIEVLHLAAMDHDPSVRAEAFRHLRDYAWQDFSGKPASLYQEWHEGIARCSITEVLSGSVHGYQARLAMLRGPALIHELKLLDEIDLAPATMRGYDARDMLWNDGEGNARTLAGRWLASDDLELQLAALEFVTHFRLEPEFVRENVMSYLWMNPWRSLAHVIAACRTFTACGQVGTAWGEDPLSVTSVRLLRLCVENDTPDVRSAVGARVLAPLLGLAPDAKRGAAEWIAAWKELRQQGSAKMLESEDARWLDAH